MVAGHGVKGIFIDEHERPDVVEARTAFLRRMVKVGFLNLLKAPTDEARNAIPQDIEPPIAEKREKTVFIFHDESTFNANDDQNNEEKKQRSWNYGLRFHRGKEWVFSLE